MSQRITKLLSANLFDGVNICNIKQAINGSEDVYILNNEDGQVVYFKIELKEGYSNNRKCIKIINKSYISDN